MKVTRVPGPGAAKLDVLMQGLAQNKQGKVGWFENSRYPNGTPVAEAAFYNEFGTIHIPARSFFRTTILEKQQEWRQVVQQGAKAIAAGTATQATVIEAVGLLAAGNVAQKIAAITSPALKQSTINARMRRYADKHTVGNLAKPLVDTGLMISTITNTVEDATNGQ